jgi:hypothetical protein
MISKNDPPSITSEKRVSSILENFLSLTMEKTPSKRSTTNQLLSHQFCQLACSRADMITYLDNYQILKKKKEEEEEEEQNNT